MKYIKGDYKFNNFPLFKAFCYKGIHSFPYNSTSFQDGDAGWNEWTSVNNNWLAIF